MAVEKKNKAGGLRNPPGGRPSKGNVKLCGYVKRGTKELIERTANNWGVTIGEALDAIIGEALDAIIADEDTK